MPLSPADEKLWNTLANDPDTVEEMVRRAKKLGVTDHPAIKEDELFQKKLASVVKPLQEELEETKKWRLERERTERYERERSSLKQRGFSDSKVAALEKRLHEDKDLPVFQSYVQAAEYIRLMESPLAPSTSPLINMPGSPISNDDSDWRQAMQSDDPKVNPLLMSKKQQRLLARANWNKASKEIQENLATS